MRLWKAFVSFYLQCDGFAVRMLLQILAVLHLQKIVFVFSDVKKTIDDLKKVLKNFESRVEFTEDLQKMSDVGICFYSLAFSRRYFQI